VKIKAVIGSFKNFAISITSNDAKTIESSFNI